MDKGSICAYGSGEEVFSQVDLLQEVGVDVPRCVRVSKGVYELSHQSEYAHLLSEADRAVCDETALSVQSAAKQLACCVGLCSIVVFPLQRTMNYQLLMQLN